MRVYLHNHTSLCNHAEGEIFEYIEKAIKLQDIVAARFNIEMESEV